MPSLALKPPNLNISLGARRGRSLVGLDIQPGYVAAVQAHVNGGITVQHAAGAPLAPDALREGEVLDERTLSEALRELFADGRLGKRVRIGLANQRTVLRTLELPPVTDRKELAAAVRFQAEDQVPMPLASAVLDFHSLGIFDTPAGPRQRVIVVAAQREMVERLLRAVRHAGLRPEGVDLSAFALIRSLYQRAATESDSERVLYLNIGGLTNMAIAEGTVCRFTRVVGGGLEAMASEIAERRGIPLVDARALLAAYDIGRAQPAAPAAAPPPVATPAPAVEAAVVAPSETEGEEPLVDFHAGFGTPPEGEPAPPAAPEPVETWALAQDPSGESARSVSQSDVAHPATGEVGHAEAPPTRGAGAPDPEVRLVLENGIREIVGEVRNSLDFHRSQDGGGEVTSVVLSGPALEMSGFAEALEADLGLTVRRQSVRGVDDSVFASVPADRLAIATGLATEQAPT
ncbi:MAG TPA: type IV pilus assembly protein PilM [Solirubrobacteraceae bacterium]|jgi:type IV pilus assembly protein PilM